MKQHPDQIKYIVDKINNLSTIPLTLIDMCDEHTTTIHKAGISSLLSDNIQLLSGLANPTCINTTSFIDKAIAFARLPDVIIATYRDLLNQPGTTETLHEVRSQGANIHIVHSPLDALRLAWGYPFKKIIFLAIGYEAAAPGTAMAIHEASQMSRYNFMVYSGHKITSAAIEAIIHQGRPVNGIIIPGHTAAILGANHFHFIPHQYHLPVVISGYQSVDILIAIYLLVYQIRKHQAHVEIAYNSAVTPQGNLKAQHIVNEIFEPHNSLWRGLGLIPNSSFKIKHAYKSFDAEERIPIQAEPSMEPPKCICGDILIGLKTTGECPLFRTTCHPDHPIGPCMASGNGACLTHYRYHLNNTKHTPPIKYH